MVFALFSLYPLLRTAYLGFFLQDPFGNSKRWVGLDQYRDVITSAEYRHSLWVTLQFMAFTVPTALIAGLGLAVLANQPLRGIRIFRTIFSSTVATSVAVASLLWLVLLQPSVGVLNSLLDTLGFDRVDLLGDEHTALMAVSATTAWQNLGVVFIVCLAGLQSIPEELYDAAKVDGAGAWARFRSLTVPMMSPTLMFAGIVLSINAFQSFGQIDLLTRGGPRDSTNVLVYELYNTLFETRDQGAASAQAIVLFAIIVALSAIQFRLMRRRVHYANG
jgi:ABC-type sugar transport system permease subunit